MRPVLFEIGNLSIYSYGFFVALGIAVATLWMIYQSKKWGKSPDIVLDCVLIAVISGVIGARLFYVFLYEADYYLA
ncbi:MAG TPA: prolipoprotein diacylglyceryl transferase, partial [Syntrophaceticus sp.]|nr:prolipoprotein diacylglyceryl transferase [Syntrophaceticus sp.]